MAVSIDMDTPVTRANMANVIVKKDALLETLQANRTAHRAIFEEALAGYKVRALEILNQHIERISKGKVEKVYVSLPQPEDHTDAYDRAIATLEWTIFDEVELTINEFDQYVRDNWLWKGEFTATTSLYNSR